MCKSLSGSSRSLLALFFIVTGIFFFMDVSLLWPVFVLAPGLVFLGIVFNTRGPVSGLAIPGMLITGTGALLFIQNLTGYWQSWAYVWTLEGVFLGMGFMLMGLRMEDSGMYNMGRAWVQISLVIFAVFAFFFEVIIGIGELKGPLAALVLIVAGALLLFRSRSGDGSKAKRKLKHEEKLFTGPVVYGTRVRSFQAASKPDDFHES